MSLDLSAKTGRAHNTVFFTGADFAAVALTTFNSGDVSKAGGVTLYTDFTANAMSANTLPVSLLDVNGVETLQDGFELTILKTDASSNGASFLDPISNVTYNYMNYPGESLTLIMDRSTGSGRWVAKV